MTKRREAALVDISELEQMGRDALLSLWRRQHGQPAPRGLSRPMLRRILAFDMQAQQLGGLPRQAERMIERELAGRRSPGTPGLQPGGRLIREWNGVTHVVDVVEGGFAWNGERHRSLSAIARAITGARWSGPRFFGLTGAGKP
ncbi:DUF2924 domain-containing protein [Thalassovita sp.]|uniref:DUF2924 domain-containing protein n=1 Tax=Thalassovita sp. TaxID=1979401 RepID=UPI0029DE7AA7|nr:DUF2924 domain-containing protein [Thalassovita sp.]